MAGGSRPAAIITRITGRVGTQAKASTARLGVAKRRRGAPRAGRLHAKLSATSESRDASIRRSSSGTSNLWLRASRPDLASSASSTGMPNWSAPGRVGGSAADILSSMADTSARSGAFNPYNVNVFNGSGHLGCDDVGQTANWRAPRTHDRAAEKQAEELRHSSTLSARAPSVNSRCHRSTVTQRPIVGHGKWSATSLEYWEALR